MEFTITTFKKHHKILLHILGWAILFLLPVIFAQQVEEGSVRSVIRREYLYLNLITKVFWVLLFYWNMVILIPKLLYQRKILLFILTQIILFAIIMGIHRFFYGLLVTNHSFNLYKSSFYNSFPFLFTVLGSIAFRAVSDRIKMDREAREKESENLKTELAFLRSQISPHFLFNVLNNIVSLVRLKSDDLEPTILKLSSLMQYMLYRTDEEKVLLKSEVDYLRSYVDLQKQRFGNRLTLHIDLQPEETWHTVEPMLFIPFIENAFKHGTGMIEKPVIDISLKAFNNELILIVKNKYIADDNVKDPDSGIGLINVKRRLELLYGKNHTLNINKTDESFTITLKILFEPC